MVITKRHLQRWSLALLGITALLGFLSPMMFWTLRGGRFNDVLMYFHLGSELGIAAYWNAALLAGVAISAVVSAMLSDSRRLRWSWVAVAAITLFMSIDEATRLHERTADLVIYNPLPTFTWVIAGIPLALGLVVVLWLVTRPLPAGQKRGLGAALGLYLLGALVFEAVGGFFWRQSRPRVSDVFGTIEEMLEMGACVMAIHLIARAWLPLRLTARADDAQPSATTAAEPDVDSPQRAGADR